jgi:predicted amidophosphoribosyltransferase
MFDSKTGHHTAIAEPVAAGSCAFCRSALPGGRVVRFCPQCGADQSMHPCPSCREPLDPSWKFCIGCGSRQS